MSAVIEARKPSAPYLGAVEPPTVQQFDLLAGASGGVARLRQLILTLAVQGKLVTQDPADEPASVLLERIVEEQGRLIGKGLLKRARSVSPIDEGDVPFELPAGWVWARLGAVLPFRIGRTPPSKDSRYWSDSGFDWVSISDMTHFGEIWDTGRKLTQRGADVFGHEPLPPGTLLMSFKLTIGKIAVLRVPAYHNEAIASFFPLGGTNTEFLKYVLPTVSGTGAAKNALMGQTLNADSISELLLALPPIAEQARIVARVDELMHLCDALEAKGRLEAEQHARLLGTLLGTLTDSTTPEELVANWQRVADHFDLLLDRPEAVDALEQTILQLAVRGLLVPQDPNDEPVSVLLDQARRQENSRSREDPSKLGKCATDLGADQEFDAPPGWEWVGLGDLRPDFQNGVASRGDAGGRAITVLRLADIKARRVSLADTRQIPIAERDIDKYRLQSGDILITRVNGSADIVGQFNLCEADLDAIYCDHFIRMRVRRDWLDPGFAALVGESDLVRNRIRDLFITTAGQKTVNQGHIGSLRFALPPVPEQSRIVARVTELRRICAALRQRLAASQTTRSHLAEALVESAIA